VATDDLKVGHDEVVISCVKGNALQTR